MGNKQINKIVIRIFQYVVRRLTKYLRRACGISCWMICSYQWNQRGISTVKNDHQRWKKDIKERWRYPAKKKQDSSLTTLQPSDKMLIPNLPEERRGRQDALLLGLGVHKVFSTHMRTLQPRRSNEKTNQKLNLSIAQESYAFFRQFVL